jgi:hypothetical protein
MTGRRKFVRFWRGQTSPSTKIPPRLVACRAFSPDRMFNGFAGCCGAIGRLRCRKCSYAAAGGTERIHHLRADSLPVNVCPLSASSGIILSYPPNARVRLLRRLFAVRNQTQSRTWKGFAPKRHAWCSRPCPDPGLPGAVEVRYGDKALRK